jgi:hypothetical protein
LSVQKIYFEKIVVVKQQLNWVQKDFVRFNYKYKLCLINNPKAIIIFLNFILFRLFFTINFKNYTLNFILFLWISEKKSFYTIGLMSWCIAAVCISNANYRIPTYVALVVCIHVAVLPLVVPNRFPKFNTVDWDATVSF